MIYFDNAATGGFKPRAVTDGAETVIRYLLANPGRSGHRLAITGAKALLECRTTVGEFFNASPEKVIFTKNCTEALNAAIFGSLRRGGHVITTVYEHNSVLRPLTYLKNNGDITLDIVSPEPNKSLFQAIKEKINPKTYLVVTNAVSNVTGEQTPFFEIGKLCKENGLLFLVDGAQAGGHIPIDIKECNISYLALAGHKGLSGIMGSGVLIIDDFSDLNPFIMGGTGSESFNLSQPLCYPERLESGTINLPAVVALNEGVKFVRKNLTNFSSHLYSATEYIIQNLNKLSDIKCYSSPNPIGIVSFAVSALPSGDVADILNSEYDVAVRGGLHCAPLMHRYLGTEKDGLVRVSLAVQNSTRELNYFLSAMKKIIGD